jgi:hypothetical protein
MPRAASKGLVTEFIERVSGVMLEDPQYRRVVAGLIKGHAGIYALYKNDALYYVGLASNLMPRVKHHLKDRHARRWDTFSVYLTRDSDHIKALESLLLRIVEPKGNRVKGKLPGAKDQKRNLHEQMVDADSNRRASLLGGHFMRNRLRRKTSQGSGTVVLAGLVNKRMALRAENKGVRYSATLRKDGHISYSGELFTSPSMAGRSALGRHVNGWLFWTYKAGRKGWVALSNLRT